MIDIVLMFFFRNLLLTPLLAWGTMHGFIGFTRAINVKPAKFVRWKIILALTVFYCSLAVFYKNTLVLSPAYDLLKELAFSFCLGLVWMWVFLEVVDALGVLFDRPKKVYLWSLFSILAFGVYVLSR